MPVQPLDPADVLLVDGRVGVVRRLVPADAGALHDLHNRVSDDTLRLRFFSPSSMHAAHKYVEHVLSDPDTLAMVAEVDGQVVGRATAEPVKARTSEIAFLVADELRGQGLGTLLLEHLAALAWDQGIRRFEADVLSENHRMLSVFSDAGSRWPSGSSRARSWSSCGRPSHRDCRRRPTTASSWPWRGRWSRC